VLIHPLLNLTMETPKFILVQAPESSILKEKEWFDECYFITEPDAVEVLGEDAYFVPENLFKTLYTDEKD
jgi:hypothetical protein